MATDNGSPQGPATAADPHAQLYAAQLAELTPTMRAQLQEVAVLHRIQQALLTHMLDDGPAAAELLTTLQRHDLVQPLAPDATWYGLEEGLRRALRAQLLNDPLRHRRAHARAAIYFSTEERAATAPLHDRNRLEYLYHLLIADEAAAIPALRYFIEQAQLASQWGVVERLLDYTNEQAPHCTATTQAWLRAATARVQAEHAVTERHWIRANAALQDALVIFQRLDFADDAAQTQLQLGQLYVRLAEATGGLREEETTLASPLLRLLYVVQHAPFLIYRRISRRFMVMPNLYFGNDFQNWTVVRFLYHALAAFAAAYDLLAHQTPTTQQPPVQRPLPLS